MELCKKKVFVTGWRPRFKFVGRLVKTIASLRQPPKLACYKAQIYDL